MYFVLQCREPDDPDEPEIASFSYEPDDEDRSWFDGLRFESPPPQPVPVTTEGGVLPDLSEVPLPMLSQRLAQALIEAGVDNLDFYPVQIRDESDGQVDASHLAFNLIGLVAAADLAASTYDSPEGPLISVDFDSLVIDEKKARGGLMFRLAECVTCIVVHESVRKFVETTGINTLDFIDPTDYVG